MSRTTGFTIVFVVIALSAVAYLLSNKDEKADAPLTFNLPVNCSPGENCWIANYVDSDPGPGVADYTGGPRSYNTHKGTDFAIRDRRAITDGIVVLAAADGVVRGSRNNMPDVDFRQLKPKAIKGRECGNGAIIDHRDGWVSQYCHLRSGSVQVKEGDQIKAGGEIGFVGLSGKSMFPHLHFQVFYNKKIVDPFTGKGSNRTNALWAETVVRRIPYKGSEIYAAGFTSFKPRAAVARQGDYRQLAFSGPTSTIYFWSDIFSVRNGDRLVFQLFNSSQKKLAQRALKMKLKRTSARRFIWVGFKHPTASWPKGMYKVNVQLSRIGDKGRESFQANRSVTIN